MRAQVHDAVVIGAGSVGLRRGLLARGGREGRVVDQFAGPGQGSNKAAIGGIRATHSSPAKIRLWPRVAARLLDVEGGAMATRSKWFEGGYVFVAYREQEERSLKKLLRIQQRYGLNIRWLESDETIAARTRHQP